MSEPTNLLATVRKVRATYDTPMTDDQCVELCNAVAWEHGADGWGLSRKVDGVRGRRYDGQECAHDILHHLPTNQLFDVLADAPKTATPVWQPKGPPQSDDRTWVAPIPPAAFSVAPVVPTPVNPAPSGPTNAEIMAVLREIQMALDLISHNAREGAMTALQTQNDLERGLSVTLNGNLFSKASGLARARRG